MSKIIHFEVSDEEERAVATGDAQIARYRVALDKIASYGERHMGYVNCRIDDMALSTFARKAADDSDN